MLNRFYYLQTGPGDNTCRQPALDAGIPLAHLVGGIGFGGTGGNAPGVLPGLLEHLYSEYGNYPFCLALHDPGNDPVPSLRALLLFFFHPYYQWGDRGKPLFVFLPPEKETGFRKKAQEFFAAQGLTIELLFMSGPAVHLLESKNDPAGEYYRYCISHWSPDDVFILKDPCPERVICDLQGVTGDLQREHPLFSKLAAENAMIRKQLALLDRDNSRLREENSILNELTELNSKHDEVDYILRFYKYEYEILPLWYKRFGHIIKVLQGRRSFRSLYDKKVKKYKD